MPDLAAAGLVQLSTALDAGEVSARELATAALERIAERDGDLNAFRTVLGEQAIAAADDADDRRRRGERGALLGVPIAVKDDVDRAGQVTGLGSRACTTPAHEDSEVVRRLRSAGAVVVGITNLPELATYGVTDSALAGVTRNPLDRGRTPGGSSGGSAAAVAAGMVGIATASDGAGSIRIPAACCGLVGFKPSAGSTPGSGGWHGLSVQGCLTREVADTAAYLDTIGDFAEPLHAAARHELAPLRVGVDLTPFRVGLPGPVEPATVAAVRATADLFASAGHRVEEVRWPQGTSPQAFTVRYLAGVAETAAQVDEPGLLEPRTAQLAALGRRIPARVVAAAVAAGPRHGRRAWDSLGVDLLLTPVLSGPAPLVDRWAGRNGLSTVLSMGRFYAFTPPWNATGQPAVSLPYPDPDGLPRAVQLVAALGADALLTTAAAFIEHQLTGWPVSGRKVS